jgi:hypothetical protein
VGGGEVKVGADGCDGGIRLKLVQMRRVGGRRSGWGQTCRIKLFITQGRCMWSLQDVKDTLEYFFLSTA